MTRFSCACLGFGRLFRAAEYAITLAPQARQPAAAGGRGLQSIRPQGSRLAPANLVKTLPQFIDIRLPPRVEAQGRVAGAAGDRIAGEVAFEAVAAVVEFDDGEDLQSVGGAQQEIDVFLREGGAGGGVAFAGFAGAWLDEGVHRDLRQDDDAVVGEGGAQGVVEAEFVIGEDRLGGIRIAAGAEQPVGDKEQQRQGEQRELLWREIEGHAACGRNRCGARSRRHAAVGRCGVSSFRSGCDRLPWRGRDWRRRYGRGRRFYPMGRVARRRRARR